MLDRADRPGSVALGNSGTYPQARSLEQGVRGSADQGQICARSAAIDRRKTP